jgi:hypothetical protein
VGAVRVRVRVGPAGCALGTRVARRRGARRAAARAAARAAQPPAFEQRHLPAPRHEARGGDRGGRLGDGLRGGRDFASERLDAAAHLGELGVQARHLFVLLLPRVHRVQAQHVRDGAVERPELRELLIRVPSLLREVGLAQGDARRAAHALDGGSRAGIVAEHRGKLACPKRRLETRRTRRARCARRSGREARGSDRDRSARLLPRSRVGRASTCGRATGAGGGSRHGTFGSSDKGPFGARRRRRCRDISSVFGKTPLFTRRS